jgi:hypothetical protein
LRATTAGGCASSVRTRAAARCRVERRECTGRVSTDAGDEAERRGGERKGSGAAWVVSAAVTGAVCVETVR